MIFRLINAFGIGLALVLLPDFIFFIGLKLHYFEYYKITEYFNVYFFDHQIFWLLGFVALSFGYLMLYTPFRKVVEVLYLFVLALSFLTLYAPVGQRAGEALFMKKDQRFRLGNTSFTGDMLYEGRKIVYINRQGIEPTVKLLKEEVMLLGPAIH